MKIWKVNDETRAICPSCERRTDVVFRNRTVELDEGNAAISGVLVAVCKTCDGTAMIPHQSTPKLKEGVRRAKETVNTRVPVHLEDILYLLADRYADGVKGRAGVVMRLLLNEFAQNDVFAVRVREHLHDAFAKGAADAEISVRVPTEILADVDGMAAKVGIPNRTEVVKALLASAKEDVLDEHEPEMDAMMRRAFAAVG